MKKITIFLLISLFCMQIGYSKKGNKSYPENKTKDFQYILKNLKLKKEYKVSDNVEQFKKVLIGNWYETEEGNLFRFLENGTYHMVYDYFKEKKQKKYFTIKGTWKIEKDSILLIPENKRRKQLKIEVDLFIVMKNTDKYIKKNGYQYELYIQVSDKTRVRTELGSLWIQFGYLPESERQNKK